MDWAPDPGSGCLHPAVGARPPCPHEARTVLASPSTLSAVRHPSTARPRPVLARTFRSGCLSAGGWRSADAAARSPNNTGFTVRSAAVRRPDTAQPCPVWPGDAASPPTVRPRPALAVSPQLCSTLAANRPAAARPRFVGVRWSDYSVTSWTVAMSTPIWSRCWIMIWSRATE